MAAVREVRVTLRADVREFVKEVRRARRELRRWEKEQKRAERRGLRLPTEAEGGES